MKKSLAALAFGTLGLGMAEFGMMSILSVVAGSRSAGVFIGKPTVKNPADYSDVHYVYRQLSGRYSS
mgnify:CR=1 FL=1